MKWLKIGTAISILILFIFGTGWRTGCPTGGDPALSLGQRCDTLNSFCIARNAAGKWLGTQSSGPPYTDVIDIRATTDWVAPTIEHLHLFDSIRVDSIQWDLRFYYLSDEDSMGLAFGFCSQDSTTCSWHQSPIVELDDTVYFYGAATQCLRHTTTIDSIPYLNSEASNPVVDVIKRDGSVVCEVLRCILFYEAFKL